MAARGLKAARVRLSGELATRIVMLSQSLEEASADLGISLERAESLITSAEYRTREAEILKRLEAHSNAAIDDYAGHVKTILMPLALQKHKEALEQEGITPMTLRAIELAYDRGGLPKVTNIQMDHRLRLDDETLNRIHELEQRATAKIPVIEGEWAYALDRPAMRQLEKPEEQFAKVEEAEVTMVPE